MVLYTVHEASSLYFRTSSIGIKIHVYSIDFSFNDLHDMKNEDVWKGMWYVIRLYSLEQENNNPVVGSKCFPEKMSFM